MAMKKKDFEKAARDIEYISGTIDPLPDDAWENFDGHYTGKLEGMKAKVALFNSFAVDPNYAYLSVKIGKETLVEGAMVDLLVDGNGAGEVWLGVDKAGRGFSVVLENMAGYGLNYDHFHIIQFTGPDTNDL